MRSLILFAFCTIFLFPVSLFAYTTHRITAGPLLMYFGTPDRLSKQEIITKLDEPLELKVKFENQGNMPLSIKLTFKTIETFELLDAKPKILELPANGMTDVTLKVIARAGTYTAHYPVRLDAEFSLKGETVSAHIIQIIKTELPGGSASPQNPLSGQIMTDPKQLPLNIVPQRSGLALATLDTYRATWNHEGKSTENLSVGFQGSEPTGLANILRLPTGRGGVIRQSLAMHPPYQGGVGNVAVEYRVQLPESNVILLSFFSAMRDTNPPETPSDGVTYRIKVDGKTVYEVHDAETTWVAHEVNLTDFAGQEILLTLENDPGPQRNPNCDSCFWGDVILFAGEKPTVLSIEEKQKLFADNLQAVKTGTSDSLKTQVFPLDGGMFGAVTLGNNGFIDGIIGLGNAEKQVQFDGLRVWVKGQLIGTTPTALNAGQWMVKPNANNQWQQEIEVAGRKGTLFFGVHKNGPALQFPITSSEIGMIDRIEFGPATHHAPRVYYGHGYCIVEPEAFTANAGGHDLSTSHVGMDFENGLSVLQATSFPPDRFVVDPKTKRYTISVHPDTTLTLLPGTKGALDCAIRFRPLHEGSPSAGVATKAGRFVFDIWGGRYKDHIDTIKFAAKYGLTDSLFLVHNWQHHGYDNCLPDIYPPNPTLGTLEEMQEALILCNSLGIQYGIHDNYTDFYPDADGYDFDGTVFLPTGQPQTGWNNYGIEAQAYFFRPDRVQRFLERNLDLMTPNLPMSTYFVDVLTSLPPIDFYDQDGNFHSRAETQRCWNKAYDTIRDRLSAVNKNFPSASTISEAGMDSLIGHLDGADSQFMFLSPEPGGFRTLLKCKEWSRVPWFDAVHHTKFSLHGVGYSSRYEAQRGRAIHGVESDDYISAEILTGHALMVEHASRLRGAVRKYWLAQDLIRHLANKEIVNVEFVEGNIYRQKITWTGNTTVEVNLGETDWIIKSAPLIPDVILPQYGYLAVFHDKDFGGYSAIHKQGGRVVESAWTEDRKRGIITKYANVRQKNAETLLPITPSLHSFKYLGENRFTVAFQWNVEKPPIQDLSVFVHCVERQQAWHHRSVDVVLGGREPVVPTSQWMGEVITENHPEMAIPDELPAGRHYLTVGLYDHKGNGQRAKLMGFSAEAFFGSDSNRYVVGWLHVERKNGKVSNITLEPFEWDEMELCKRLLPPKEPVEFDFFCKTQGGFKVKVDRTEHTILLTPLPEEPNTEIALSFPWGAVKSLKAIDEVGRELQDVPFMFNVNERYPLVFTTQSGEFGYKIVW